MRVHLVTQRFTASPLDEIEYATLRASPGGHFHRWPTDSCQVPPGFAVRGVMAAGLLYTAFWLIGRADAYPTLALFALPVAAFGFLNAFAAGVEILGAIVFMLSATAHWLKTLWFVRSSGTHHEYLAMAYPRSRRYSPSPTGPAAVVPARKPDVAVAAPPAPPVDPIRRAAQQVIAARRPQPPPPAPLSRLVRR